MAGPKKFVIVGAGLAGAKAAETLRTEGFDGRITLIGEEPVVPYERPPLSKALLRGEVEFESTLVHGTEFYSSNRIDLRTSSTVTSIDPEAATATLASGERLSYDRLLLATGAEPRRLSVPGSTLPGVSYLRTLDDAYNLRRLLTACSKVVVVGAGWIGSEVAASCRQLGAEVHVVEPGRVPLERVLGPELGSFYRALHEEHGVHFHLGTGVERIEGSRMVDRVVLTDGTIIPAHLVVVGIGVVPRDELARYAGLELRDGIVTDQYLATAAPGVFAAGDVAKPYHPVYRRGIRLEHWSAALHQGPVAARNMLGRTTAYEQLPYFFSDQYDVGMEFRGSSEGADQLVIRGRLEEHAFIAFWLEAGTIRAAMNVNVWDQGPTLEHLLGRPGRVDPGRLGDPEVDLAELSPRAQVG